MTSENAYLLPSPWNVDTCRTSCLRDAPTRADQTRRSADSQFSSSPPASLFLHFHLIFLLLPPFLPQHALRAFWGTLRHAETSHNVLVWNPFVSTQREKISKAVTAEGANIQWKYYLKTPFALSPSLSPVRALLPVNKPTRVVQRWVPLVARSSRPARPHLISTKTMVNPGGNSQPPAVGTGSLSWKRCAGCGGKIADRFLLYTMDSYWHSRCLKCSCCQAQLGEIGTSCYTKSGMILCRNDYIRLFGNSGACSACGQSIPASELVMRAQGNVYHLKCFTCSTCRNRLVPGDRFHYINGSLFCEHDRPTALINGHLSSLQTNPLLPDQKPGILLAWSGPAP
ncbi:hypothetical protein CCH79_00011067 [Gambusia affinis]|uniref:LIM zinc-binding domain-containing protein n=1 Tax=Gambusia affinis TaxID=33528 RepID=A0A315USW6_GAMAF|nr:hypothetical protein CCH79_00011067 [Gambusia affinis]